MSEKILSCRKNGMVMLFLFGALYFAAFALVIFEALHYSLLMILGIIWMFIGWILFLGLKVLKPKEALVLTLFGKYIGTLKKEVFYFVNPFCTAVNPGAKTKLYQSGDVDGGNSGNALLSAALTKSISGSNNIELSSKRFLSNQ